MAAMAWDEAELLRWLARRARPRILAGSQGHDAAVLRAAPGKTVVCADQVIEGVHAEPGCPGRALGRKAAGRALSDLAATAALPRALVLCVAAPPSEHARRLRAVIEGADEKARGVVQIKDLALGARLAADIETREDWKAQPAQMEIARVDLVAEVRAMIARAGG
jgi:hypothetical protein